MAADRREDKGEARYPLAVSISICAIFVLDTRSVQKRIDNVFCIDQLVGDQVS